MEHLNKETNQEQMYMDFLNKDYQDVIDYLNDCQQACYEAFDACLQSSNLNEKGDLLKALIDCAQHCQLTVGYLARESMHIEEMALISAHLAKVCAAECEEFEDDFLKACAHVCMETANTCIEYFDD